MACTSMCLLQSFPHFPSLKSCAQEYYYEKGGWNLGPLPFVFRYYKLKGWLSHFDTWANLLSSGPLCPFHKESRVVAIAYIRPNSCVGPSIIASFRFSFSFATNFLQISKRRGLGRLALWTKFQTINLMTQIFVQVLMWIFLS